jgi:hypothetical protein
VRLLGLEKVGLDGAIIFCYIDFDEHMVRILLPLAIIRML